MRARCPGLTVCVCSDVQDPRALAQIFEKAEAELAARAHPDPYRREYRARLLRRCPANLACVAPTAPDGTKWCVLVFYRGMFAEVWSACAGSATPRCVTHCS